MKTPNLSKWLWFILPSVFFIVVLLSSFIGSPSLSLPLICGAVALVLLGNLFLQNKVLGRVMGIIFLLISCYMIMAILDDVTDGEATVDYWFGAALFTCSIVMSVLLIKGYDKKRLTYD